MAILRCCCNGTSADADCLHWLMYFLPAASVRLLEDALRWWSADLFSPEELARDKAASEALVRVDHRD